LTASLTQSDSGKKRKIKALGSGAAAEFGDGPDMHKIPLRKRLQSISHRISYVSTDPRRGWPGRVRSSPAKTKSGRRFFSLCRCGSFAGQPCGRRIAAPPAALSRQLTRRPDGTGRCDRCGSLEQSRAVRTACLEVGDVLQGGLCDGGEGFSREEGLVAGDNHVRKRQRRWNTSSLTTSLERSSKNRSPSCS
jgi:hypothetical protein